MPTADTRHSVSGLAVLFTAGFVTITTETLPLGLLPSMSRDLDVAQSRIGLLVGVYALLVMVATFPLIGLTRGWSRRPLLIGIMACFAVGNLLMVIAPNYQVVVIARIATALGHGVLWSSMAAYAIRLARPERAGRAVAAVFAANSAALTLGVPLGATVGEMFGWRTPFAVLAVSAAVVAAAAAMVLPDLPGTDAPSRGPVAALRRPGVAAIAAVTGLAMLGHFALFTYIAPVLMEAGLPERRIGQALFSFGVAGILGVILAGILGDRAPRTGLLAVLGAMTASIAALGLVNGYAALAIMALWGIVYAALPILGQTSMLRAASSAQTEASALFIITFNLGITAGSVLGGALLEVWGSSALPVAGAVLTGTALLVGLRIPRGAEQSAGRMDAVVR